MQAQANKLLAAVHFTATGVTNYKGVLNSPFQKPVDIISFSFKVQKLYI